MNVFFDESYYGINDDLNITNFSNNNIVFTPLTSMTTFPIESSQSTPLQQDPQVGQTPLEQIRRIEKGKIVLIDFIEIFDDDDDDDDARVPPPSPPQEVFKDFDFVEQPMDADKTIVLSIIPEEEANDERIIVVTQLLSNDEFIKTIEFKIFWVQAKLKNMLKEEMANFDKENVDCTLEETKEMINSSGMMLLPTWDMQKLCILDQIMRQEDPIYA